MPSKAYPRTSELSSSRRLAAAASVAQLRPFGTVTAAGATAQRESQLVYKLPARPRYFRILPQNMEATPPTGITAAVSGSTTIGAPAYVQPEGGTWVQQTWAGATSLANGPTRVSALHPGTDFTADVMQINVPERTDGDGYLLFVRVHPGTGNFTYMSQAGTSIANAATLKAEANAGRCGYLLSATRNNTTSTAAGSEGNYTAGVADANLAPLYILEVWFDNGMRVLYDTGDSLAAGSGTISGLFSLPVAAAHAAGMAYINDGLSGSTSDAILARTLAFLSAAQRQPGVVYIPAWTPNDYGGGVVTDAKMNTAKGRFLTALDAANRTSWVERVVTGSAWPWDVLDAANDAKRKEFNVWLLGLQYPKLRTVNLEYILSNGATPARWKAGFSPDGLHNSEQAVAAAQLAFATALA